MARSSYASSGRGSGRSRSGSRGRSSSRGRPSSGGGGGNGPMILAAVLVVGAVGAFIAFGGGKKSEDSPKPAPANNQPVRPDKPDVPAGPQKMDPPKIGNDLFSQGRELIKQMKTEYETASNLYDDAQLVKDDDPDQWQAMLREANEHMGAIMDLWNEIVAIMPSNDDWDEEATADHWFGREYQKVGKVDELRMAIRKNIRSK